MVVILHLSQLLRAWVMGMTCVMRQELVQCDCRTMTAVPNQLPHGMHARVIKRCLHVSNCRPADKSLLSGVPYHNSPLQSGALLLEVLTVCFLIDGTHGAGPLMQAVLQQQPIQSTSDEPCRHEAQHCPYAAAYKPSATHSSCYAKCSRPHPYFHHTSRWYRPSSASRCTYASAWLSLQGCWPATSAMSARCTSRAMCLASPHTYTLPPLPSMCRHTSPAVCDLRMYHSIQRTPR